MTPTMLGDQSALHPDKTSGSKPQAYTCAVTLGLPSLSPPIQDPKVRGVVPIGSSLPVCFFSAALSLRM